MTDQHLSEKSIFLVALEKESPPERAAYLDEACSGDRWLRSEVEALLAAHDRLGDLPPAPEAMSPEATADEPAVTEIPGMCIGPYKLLQKLGHGGMGIVFLAEDTQLQRRVALKTMRPALAAQAAARQRFLREARATAAIKHDHIVTIYQVGEERDMPYLAMELLEGETLEARLAREDRLPVVEVLRISREIAEGLDAAHRAGLIHRDIKPSNIWLESGRVVSGGVETGKSKRDGDDPLIAHHSPLTTHHSPRVKILDFGLARAAGDTHNPKLAETGFILGTPAYMAPEQARSGAVDHRADLFSLGCVLYRLCTAEAPFQGADRFSTLAALARDTPAPPREVNSAVPPALSDLVMQLLAKDPAGRPGSARAVIEALDVVPATRHAPTPRKVTPRRALLAAAATVLCAVFGLVAVGVVRIPTSKGQLVIETDDPNVEVIVKQGGATIIDPTTKRQFELKPGDYEVEVREVPDGMRFTTKKVTIERGDKKIVSVTFEPRPPGAQDLPKLQVSVEAVLGDPRFREWSTVFAVAFSPDGKILASGNEDRTVRLWDVATGKELDTLIGHQDWTTSVAFTPDSRTLVSGSKDRTVKLWNVSTGKLIRTLSEHQDAVLSVAVSADGQTLASGSRDRTVKLWKVDATNALHTLTGHKNAVTSVAFSPDGTTLASGSEDRTVRLWKVATGKELSSLSGHGDMVSSVVFGRGGEMLASASHDRTVRVWEIEKGKVLRTLTGHQGDVQCLAVSADGQTLASGSADATVKLWKMATGEELRTLTGCTDYVASVAFRADGEMIAVGCGGGGAIRLWTPGGKLLSPLTGHRCDVRSVAFSRDGKLLASGSIDGTVKLWQTATWKELRTLTGHERFVYSVAFSPDGKLLASGSIDGTVKLSEPTTGKVLHTLTGHKGQVFSVAFRPDGKVLASGSADRTVKLWEVATGKVLRTSTGHSDMVFSVAFSPDGEMLASCGDDAVRLWDADTGEELRALAVKDTVLCRSVAFGGNGRLLARAGWEAAVRLYQVDTGKELPPLLGHGHWILSVAFSADGQMLASTGMDRSVRIWDPATGTLRKAVPLGPPVPGTLLISQVAFSPDGRRLATANSNGTVTILRLEPATEKGK